MRPLWKRIGLRGGVVVLVLSSLAGLLVILDIALDEPLRRRMERTLDEKLVGYSVRLGGLDLHVWDGSLDLEDMQVFQDAHPDPPIAFFPLLSASVQWKALLFGRVVADVRLDSPALHLNLLQLDEEASDEVPVDRKGWQAAVEAIYPFKINELVVNDGSLVYVDEDPNRPLRASRITFVADNIRNVASDPRVYPSEVRLDATLFDSGSLSMQGYVDFLGRPHPGLEVRLSLGGAELSFLSPVLERYGLVSHQGTLSAEGDLEYSDTVKRLDLSQVEIAGTHVEFRYRDPQASEKDQQEARTEVVQTAEQLQDAPGTLTRIGVLRVKDSRLTITNTAARPRYRIWWQDIDMDVRNVTNQPEQGEARAALTALFMGSGRTRADVTFLPSSRSAQFRVNLAIEETRMEAMNDLLRAHGRFDVVDGLFSVYAESQVRDGRITGWIKPLFRDLKVYSAAQDRQEGFWHRMYEKTVGAVAKILKNRPRDEVATVVDISGQVDDPDASTLQIVMGLMRNAFVKAILPGMDREVKEGGGAGKDRPRKKT